MADLKPLKELAINVISGGNPLISAAAKPLLKKTEPGEENLFTYGDTDKDESTDVRKYLRG